jgi:hypothetical protein
MGRRDCRGAYAPRASEWRGPHELANGGLNLRHPRVAVPLGGEGGGAFKPLLTLPRQFGLCRFSAEKAVSGH